MNQYSPITRWLLPWFVIPFLLLSVAPAYAQEDEKEKAEDEDEEQTEGFRLKHGLEAGFTLGGQVSNESLVYKSGLLFQYTADAAVSTRVFYGLGVGVEKFDTETFIPIFASFKGFLKKKDNSPYLSAQLGYALGSNRNYENYAGYEFDGGVLFSPGVGYRFSVADTFSALISVNYKHQFAKSSYHVVDGNTFRTTLNYDFVSFRVGVWF